MQSREVLLASLLNVQSLPSLTWAICFVNMCYWLKFISWLSLWIVLLSLSWLMLLSLIRPSDLTSTYCISSQFLANNCSVCWPVSKCSIWFWPWPSLTLHLLLYPAVPAQSCDICNWPNFLPILFIGTNLIYEYSQTWFTCCYLKCMSLFV